MKTRLAAFAVAAALAAGAAWAQKPPIRTGVDATFAPHAMPRLGGGLEGFNVELGREIGRRLDRVIEIEPAGQDADPEIELGGCRETQRALAPVRCDDLLREGRGAAGRRGLT